MGYLFNTTAEIKQFITVGTNFSPEAVEPYLAPAAERYLRPWLEGQLDELVTAYNAGPLSPPLDALLPYVQRALINLAFWHYAPTAHLLINDAGISVATSEVFKPASMGKATEFRDELIAAGFDAIEPMLEFLEDNVVDYPIWAVSPAPTRNRELFINTSRVFSDSYPLKEGRRTFEHLRPLMKQVETFNILPILGQTYFDEIKFEILNDSLSIPNQTALDIIRNASAHLTIAAGLTRSWVALTADGVATSERIAIQENVKQKSSGGITQVSALAEKSIQTGDAFVNQLHQHLYNNLPDYPTFENGEAYIEPPVDNPTNDPVQTMLDANRQRIGLFGL